MKDNKQEDKHSKAFEKLYLKERKKSQLFIMVTIVLSILLIGSVVLNLQNQKLSLAQNSNQSQGLSGPFSQNSGRFQGSGSLQRISGFFKEDGTVDTSEVNQITDNLPEGFEDRFASRILSQINNAVKEGQITSEQGEDLKAAFGISSDKNVN